MAADGEGISGTNPMHGRLALIKPVIINPLHSRVMSLTVSWLVFNQCGGSFVRGLIITNGWVATPWIAFPQGRERSIGSAGTPPTSCPVGASDRREAFDAAPAAR